ncbi:class I SAM-dependent methyltransferase [Cellulosilyticum ruminicola]|uniref:class I SAM-dependent methyltransferase n=1 Tax=Cellulosilyticum ruminicola TaxID=425254 RepID=UPI0006CF23D7|nr:class I SAM-dependent methyltransferase [Cellulosilyticum ruminicola]
MWKLNNISPDKNIHILGKLKYFNPSSFLTLPIPDHSIDAIISSYAFYHLSDDKKSKSIKLLTTKLTPQDKIIITDTMYETNEVAEDILQDSLDKGATSLTHDLKTEFYTTHAVLRKAFADNGF